MSVNLEQLKAACVYVEAQDQRGSGYFVAPGWVATCAHVVRKAGVGGRLFVRLQDGAVRGAAVHQIDEGSDCAVVRLDEPSTVVRPLRLGRSTASGASFIAYGFPAVAGAAPVGVTVAGTVRDPAARTPASRPALLLFCQEAAAGMGALLGGFSGSPVVVGDAVIGHLMQIIPTPESDQAPRAEMGLVYACPASQVLALLPAGIVEASEPAAALTWGIDSPATPYGARIRGFFAEYLGTPERPVAFGGRAAALASLAAWLDEPLRPSCQLVVAPAGRGKSALLAHFAMQSSARPDVEVVFVPVSIRFRTNLADVFFPALLMRLAALLGVPPPAMGAVSAEELRGHLTDYLGRSLPGGRKLVVIIDGVDEAAGWELGADLVPFPPPPGLRLVLSARQLGGDVEGSSWLQSLGWERPGRAQVLMLSTLEVEGVADVLTGMGWHLETLSTRPDIVGELYRLSEGDPLLLRLLIDELWERGAAAARLHVDDLSALQPGLPGYFARWWDEQRRLWGSDSPLREQAVQTLLNLLACALGPLSQEDIYQLAPTSLTTWTLEQALVPLSRIIIGDGRAQGYVFTHPRLALWFQEKLARAERRHWEERFLSLGRQLVRDLNAGQVSPDQASVYMLQCYGAHLESAGAPASHFTGLVSAGWRQAWLAQTGTYAGFLTDVWRLWRAASAANGQSAARDDIVPYLSEEVSSALCHGSVSNLAQSLPPPLLSALVKEQIWSPTQGLAYVSQIPGAEQQVAALVALLPNLSAGFLSAALDFIAELEPEEARCEALSAAVPYLPAALIDRTLAMARALGEHSALVLMELCPRLSTPLQRAVAAEAVALARAWPPSRQKADVLTGAARCWGEPGSEEILREALAVAWTIESPDARFLHMSAVNALLPLLPEDLLEETLARVRALPQAETWVRTRLLCALHARLPDALREPVMQDMLAAVDVERDPEACVEILPHLTGIMREQITAKAFAKARTIFSPPGRATAISQLLPYLDPATRAEAVVAALKYLRRSDGKVLQELLDTFLADHFGPLPGALLQEMLAAVRKHINKAPRVTAYARLLRACDEAARDEIFREALTTAHSIDREEVRASALLELALCCAGAQKDELLSQVRATAQVAVARGGSEVAASVARELIRLAPELHPPLQQQVLGAAVKEAARTRELWGRFAIWQELVPQLSPALLRQALKEVQGRQDSLDRGLSLAELFPSLSPSVQQRVLPEILGVLHLCADRSRVSRTLAQLLPAASEPLVTQIVAFLRGLSDEEDVRFNTITALLPYLPVALQGELATELLSPARTRLKRFPHVFARLVPHLPAPLKTPAIKEVMAAVAASTDKTAPWAFTALTYLVPAVAGDKRDKIVGQAIMLLPEAFSEDWVWDQGADATRRDLVRLCAGVSAARRHKIVGLIRYTAFEYQVVLFLIQLVADASAAQREVLVKEALQAVNALSDERTRCLRWLDLLPYLPAAPTETELAAALRTLRAATTVWGDNDFELARALCQLARYLPAAWVPEAMAVASLLNEPADRALALASLLPLLAESQRAALAATIVQTGAWQSPEITVQLLQLPRCELYPLWQRLLRQLATCSRKELPPALGALVPLMVRLGGGAVPDRVATDILESGAWWP